LRHYPDHHVRPGGTSFGAASMANPTISPLDESFNLDGIELTVSPLLETIPIGAPVRVNVQLKNGMNQDMLLPSDLSLKGGNIKGTVIGSNGQVRTFSPIIICMDGEQMEVLKVGQSIHSDLTLLRGKEGALFPNAGLYTIEVVLHWDVESFPIEIKTSTSVMVTPVVDEAHAIAAMKTLSTPDLLLTLAFGGDHLKEGVEALHIALKNKTLRPHFCYTESKRIAKPYFKRKADLKKAAELITKDAVMSKTEILKAKLLFKELDTADKKSVNIILDAK
jgi:hypothetical protein